jgi:hypothetical protein
MCTLIVGFYPGAEVPLVIGANRDESPTRPSETWKHRDNGIFCPLDMRGGTWIGTNDSGLFAAITNWDITYKKYPVSKSRGSIVLDTLTCKSIEEVGCFWSTCEPKNYRPFNLLVGSNKHLWHLSCDGKDLVIDKLSTGLHIATGWGVNAIPVRESLIRKDLRKNFCNFSNPVQLFSIKKILHKHILGNPNSEMAVCVHDETHHWETVSSALLELRNRWYVHYSDNAPCKTNKWNIELVT